MFTTDREDPVKLDPETAIGVDLDISHAAVTSEGEVLITRNITRKLNRRIGLLKRHSTDARKVLGIAGRLKSLFPESGKE